MKTETLLALAREVIEAGTKVGLRVAVAESCTGGLISAYLTEIPGSSAVVDRGFVTYSNEAKQELLNVSEIILENWGAVSAQTAAAMVSGALKESKADIAISVTGIAGPGGGSAEKPVGLVYMGYAKRNAALHHKKFLFSGDRQSIRLQTVQEALNMLLQLIRS